MIFLVFERYLRSIFPDINVYTAFIDRDVDKCVGLYLRDSIPSRIALGGIQNTSYGVMPIRLLVRWTESTHECYIKAQEIFDYFLITSNVIFENRRFIAFNMLDAGPIELEKRDDGFCEAVIRINIMYDREEIGNG